MIDRFDPFAAWQSGLRAWMFTWDVHTVMALRLTGLAGWHSLPRGEAVRMTAEKTPAFAKALTEWQRAAWAGGDWQQQSDAFTRPLSRKARANRHRLTRPATRRS